MTEELKFYAILYIFHLQFVLKHGV